MARKPYCTQNDGDCKTCSLVNYGRDCQNNPVHGGPRPGSGRPPIDNQTRRPRAIRLSDTEYEAVKKFVAEMRK